MACAGPQGSQEERKLAGEDTISSYQSLTKLKVISGYFNTKGKWLPLEENNTDVYCPCSATMLKSQGVMENRK